MAKAKRPQDVKLIISLFSADSRLIKEIRGILVDKFGRVDYESRYLLMQNASYYEAEMGKGLKRKFYSFKDLVNPGKLADIKVYTNKLENKYLHNGKRLINIDPGYITEGKLVLATAKNHQHRIYLKKGIYAEVTLRYKPGGFISWEWTYPDYASLEFREVFNKIIKKYRKQLK